MTPQILTSGEQSNFLSEQAMNADRLDLMVVRAENKILNRYREVDNDQDPILDAHYDSDVQLDGYVEDDNGDPDIQNMDEGLLFALRDAAARIVEFWAAKPDEHVESKSQGARSVTFRDKDLPSSVYAPLRPFDERRAWY